MMTIRQIEVTVGEITNGYINNEEQGGERIWRIAGYSTAISA